MTTNATTTTNVAVDLFAGWGGMSIGAEQAGVRVALAANHWPLAVEAHALHHPSTAHECQDLRQFDWRNLPQHDMLLSAPACQGHSMASQPKRRGYHDALRATAWAVVDCVEVCRPRVVVVENVPQFARWELYDLWCSALVRLGYQLNELALNAADFGVPQKRRRLFIVATRERWAFARPQAPAVPSFGPCIDWDAGRWRPITGARSGARRRIRAGQARHGRRFVVQHVTGHTGLPLTEPLRTVTTGDQWHVVNGEQYRPLTVRETARAMGFPDSYSWPASSRRCDQITGLGNAVCPPVARELCRQLMA